MLDVQTLIEAQIKGCEWRCFYNMTRQSSPYQSLAYPRPMLTPLTSSHIKLKSGLNKMIDHLNIITWASHYGWPIDKQSFSFDACH